MLLQSRNHQAFDIKGVSESSHAPPSVRAMSSPILQGRKYMAGEREESAGLLEGKYLAHVCMVQLAFRVRQS